MTKLELTENSTIFGGQFTVRHCARLARRAKRYLDNGNTSSFTRVFDKAVVGGC